MPSRNEPSASASSSGSRRGTARMYGQRVVGGAEDDVAARGEVAERSHDEAIVEAGHVGRGEQHRADVAVQRRFGGGERRRLERASGRRGGRPATRPRRELSAQRRGVPRPRAGVELGVGRRGERAEDDRGGRAELVSPS